MKRALLIYLSTFCVLGATWWEMRRSIDTPPWSLDQSLDTIPMEWEAYKAVNGTVQEQELEVLAPTSYIIRSYQHEAEHFELLITYFASQHAGKSMHSPKNCLPGAGWEPVESRILQVTPTGEPPAPVNLYRIRNGEQSLMMLYWYQSPGRVVASELNAKGFLFWDRMNFNRSPGSIVRITMPDKPESLDKGLRVAQWLIPQVRRCIGAPDRKSTEPAEPAADQSPARSASEPNATP